MANETENIDNEFSQLKEAIRLNENIPLEVLRTAARSEDLQAQGLAYSVLHNARLRARVSPAATFDDYQSLHFRYLPRCLLLSEETEWCELPYLAGNSIASWLKHLAQSPIQHQELLEQWTLLLAELYRGGDHEVRTRIINGILEHALPSRGVLEAFTVWSSDPLLSRAIQLGLDPRADLPSSI